MTIATPNNACLIGLLTIAALFPRLAAAEEFQHSFVKGDKYRILSQVSEDVYFNRRFNHSTEIVNRIAFEVAEVRADGAGLLRGTFQTGSTSSSGYRIDQEYQSEYWQLPSGRYEIGPQYFMPVVRHVPTFPPRQLQPGDTWTAPAEERHDFRSDFGIPDPYVIPIEVRYEYVGPSTWQGQTVQVFRASYTVFYQPGPPPAWNVAYPVQISGFSNQIHYWDPERGGLLAYEEQFKFIFELSTGAIVEYRGLASAQVVEAELMNREVVVDQVRDAVGDLPGVSIQSDQRGVTISLEDIRFVADSTALLPGEMDKLRQIAAILRGIPGYELLVAGHTARVGSAESQVELSVARATAVADILIGLGVRAAEDISIIGYGAERPVADNNTEAGRARNRRVEITILEN